MRVRCWRGDLLHGGTGEILAGDVTAPRTDDAVTVREYRPADAPALVALFRDTILRATAGDYNPAQLRAWAGEGAAPANWVTRFEGRYVRVAEVCGVVAGFAELEADGHIDRVYVSADHARRGIGRALLTDVIAEAARRGDGLELQQLSFEFRAFAAPLQLGGQRGAFLANLAELDVQRARLVAVACRLISKE